MFFFIQAKAIVDITKPPTEFLKLVQLLKYEKDNHCYGGNKRYNQVQREQIVKWYNLAKSLKENHSKANNSYHGFRTRYGRESQRQKVQKKYEDIENFLTENHTRIRRLLQEVCLTPYIISKIKVNTFFFSYFQTCTRSFWE